MADETPQASFLQAFYNRMSHPVLGVWSFALLIWNWRTIFFLFVSDLDAEQRIDNAMAYSDWITITVLPAVTAIVYAGLSPLLSALVEMYSDFLRQKLTLKLIKRTLDEMDDRATNLSKYLRSSQARVGELEQAERDSQATLANSRRIISEFETKIKGLIEFDEKTIRDFSRISESEFVELRDKLDTLLSVYQRIRPSPPVTVSSFFTKDKSPPQVIDGGGA